MRSSIIHDAKLEKKGEGFFCHQYWFLSRAMLWGTCLWDIWALEERHKEVIMVNNGSCWLGQGIYSDNNTALRCQTAQVFSSKQFRSNNCFYSHSFLFSFLSPPLRQYRHLSFRQPNHSNLGKTSMKKKRFLSGIARMRGGGSSHARIFWPFLKKCIFGQ